MNKKKHSHKSKCLSGNRIQPKGITGKESLEDIISNSFFAYNSARLKEVCRLFTEKMLNNNVTVGVGLAGALTPAGIGCSCIVPLIKAGFVDWIVSTGANMYHDLHFAANKSLYAGTHQADDSVLKKKNIVRIYDIFLGQKECLLATDNILRNILKQPEFQKEMSTRELYYRLGKYASQLEEKTGQKNTSILSAAYKCGVPIYTSSPGDSSIGLEIAGLKLKGSKLKIDVSKDVNETASIVLDAKKKGGRSAVLLVGGGSPKNFILQTEPYIQEILKIKETGHDYFIQITDARPDTGGLSGATPNEAVSWGKIDPKSLPDSVVCYIDSTVALPVITHYALAKHKKRKCKKLYTRMEDLMRSLKNKC